MSLGKVLSARDGQHEITSVECVGDVAAISEVSTITCVDQAYAGVKEVTRITCVADVAGSLNAKYFRINDDTQSAGVWIDVGNSGTSVPSGASSLDRAIEITTITSGMSAHLVAGAIATTLHADSKFTAYNIGADLYVTDASVGTRVDAIAGDSGFLMTVVTQGTASWDLNGKYFLLQDTAGSVGVWFDVDNSGTSIPSGASSATRAIEVTTVTSGMTAKDVAGVLATKLHADSKYASTSALSIVTVTDADAGARTNIAAGDTGFTVAVATAGANADSLNATYFKVSDDAGTVGFWFDVDNSGTSEPAGSASLDRDVEITTIVTGDSASTVATKLAAVVNADSKFGATASDSTVTITDASQGVRVDGADGTQASGFTVTITKQGALTFESESIESSGEIFSVFASGTFAATLKIQFSPDGGTTWFDDSDLTFTAKGKANFQVAATALIRFEITSATGTTAIDAWLGALENA